jgi:LmbE family N-acetylglucosaminyl deacetylase
MAKAKEDGHRVVLVVATRGEHGEVDDGVLEVGESLADRRVVETHAAATIMGVDRVEFLGYVDSGLVDTPENDLPGSFWTADVAEAAARLAAILEEERADVLTCYDQVHRVGLRAGGLAGTPKVFQSTINRDALVRLMESGRERMLEAGLEMPDFESSPDFGMPEAVITCAVDVRAYVPRKRDAMRAHASQIGEKHFMLTMPDDAFEEAFGTEWFIRDGEGPGITETELL